MKVTLSKLKKLARNSAVDQESSLALSSALDIYVEQNKLSDYRVQTLERYLESLAIRNDPIRNDSSHSRTSYDFLDIRISV